MGTDLRELARGLASLSAASWGNIRVLGLTHLDFSGGYRVVEDLAAFNGSPDVPSPGPREHYRWAYTRRLALWKALRSIDADAIHLGDPHATPLFMGLTKARRIVTCHDLIPVRFPERYLGWKDGGVQMGLAIERRRYRDADRVVAISDSTRHDVCSLLGVPPERVVRVHNGVDVDRWSAPSPPASTARRILEHFDLADRDFLIYVGGADWHKNIDGMIRGLAEARKSGADLRLAWAAYLKPEQRANIAAMARTAGVEDAVQFLGYVPDEDLLVLYRAAIAHVLVSRAEGFGLTVVESQACGCPVLTTSGGSLAEVAGAAALRVDANDPAAIGAAMLRLYREPALRADLIALGRERAPLFSRQRQAEEMVRVYRDFLDA
jgi:glycosyltransferase involved in cell wall biosynthesis